MNTYPTELEAWVTTASGERLFVRPVRADDATLLRREVDQADPETLYQRFFTPQPRINDDTITYLTAIDYQRRMALVAFTEDGEAAGIARYEALEAPNRAEVAVTVKPSMRRRGIARLLLEMVVHRAHESGFDELEAVCLIENEAAINVVSSLGFEFGPPDQGLVIATLPLNPRTTSASTSS
ncbi:MAG: GNAT family N-acetyltransferase [Acidimicrobiia bacterium]|nr:GNAT family N-acetyltransferase [Acidimicrobiia bacterium]